MIMVFYGSFVSATAGSRGASETIAAGLAELGYSTKLVSTRPRPVERALESLSSAARGSEDLAIVDIFSSRVIHQTRVVARLLALRRVPYIAILRGGALLERYEDIRRPLEAVLARAARIITPSLFLRAGFVDRGFDVEHMPNPLALTRFPYRERTVPENPLRMLWVRSFSEIYRPQLAVEIVQSLFERGINSTLTMVGPDRGLLDATRKRSKELGIENRIVFSGPVPNAELYSYYHSHDFFLNTTRFESFGVAVAEAAATGLPVISSAVGELAHAWIDGQNIILINEPQGRAFADRIAKMIGEDQNGTLYRALSVNAYRKVCEFESSRVLGRWEALLETLGYAGRID